jgi:hypothetical protein
MKINEYLAQGHKLATWIEHQVQNSPPMNDSLRVRLAVSCFIVAQEHHQAILLLLSQNPRLNAPAFALVRIVFDAYIRDVWLAYCATDETLELFSKGTKLPPDMKAMLAAIKEIPDFGLGQLSNDHKRKWSIMCDYTHTGLQQILRWNTSDAIEQNYSDAEVEDVLSFTGALVLLSTIGIASITDDEALAERVLVQAHEFSYVHEIVVNNIVVNNIVVNN